MRKSSEIINNFFIFLNLANVSKNTNILFTRYVKQYTPCMNIFSTFDKIDVCISKIEIMSPILIFLLYQIGIFHVFFNSLNIC
jgi:hypothetical protein